MRVEDGCAVVSPAIYPADNAPAVRAREKAGFHPVGIARHRDTCTEGPWQDGLLMDGSKEEFQPPSGDAR